MWIEWGDGGTGGTVWWYESPGVMVIIVVGHEVWYELLVVVVMLVAVCVRVCVFVWLCELRMVIIAIVVRVIVVFLLAVVVMAAMEEISQLQCY